jgi:hypothetical protein
MADFIPGGASQSALLGCSKHVQRTIKENKLPIAAGVKPDERLG